MIAVKTLFARYTRSEKLDDQYKDAVGTSFGRVGTL